MTSRALVFNAGSSTIKFGIYELAESGAQRVAKGHLDLRISPLVFRFTQGDNSTESTLSANVTDDLHDVVAAVTSWLSDYYGGESFIAAGHRIVHGGMHFTSPVWVDAEVLEQLDQLAPLAPLHQPAGLNLIRAMQAMHPEMPQLACFDTAFHSTQLQHARRMAIPRALHDEGVRRYGFHGLSYEYIAGELQRTEPSLANSKWVVAHLGSGASLCAIHNGRSVDTSMGFSALDGIPMATRPGELDAGVPLYLQQQKGFTVDDLQSWLYHDCGLKGVSGISADARVLAESDDPIAADTMDYFAFRIARTIAALASSLQGIDGVVFTAGIGENQPGLRANVVARLGWLGAKLDDRANAANAWVINADDSALQLRVIPTDEEQIIANAIVEMTEELTNEHA